MEIVDVHREAPAEHQEAGHLGPQTVADDQGVGADIKRWCRAELAAPASDDAYEPEIRIQQVDHQAEYTRQIAVIDLILEIYDGDRAKPAAHARAHVRSGFAPIRRSRA